MVGTVIFVNYDVKYELDKLKEDELDGSKDYTWILKRLIDKYKKKELVKVGY